MKNEPLCHAPCPIARSLGRIGDSWSMIILRDALAGFTRFDEFQKNADIAPNILSRRLKALVETATQRPVQAMMVDSETREPLTAGSVATVNAAKAQTGLEMASWRAGVRAV